MNVARPHVQIIFSNVSQVNTGLLSLHLRRLICLEFVYVTETKRGDESSTSVLLAVSFSQRERYFLPESNSGLKTEYIGMSSYTQEICLLGTTC